MVGKDDLGRSQPKISQFFQGSGKIARNREGSKEANVKEEGIEGGKQKEEEETELSKAESGRVDF